MVSLKFSQVSQEAIELSPVSLEKTVAHVLQQCQTEIEEKQAQIEVVSPLPAVQAHAATLGQVITNVLSNALKFVAPGVHPRVRIRAEEKPDTVRLWVEDNGIGLAPAQKERAFRVFERLHGKAYEGTGIGLAIVRKGTERMKGHVGVESTPGQGSRFWIELTRR